MSLMSRFWFKTGIMYDVTNGGSLVLYQRMFKASAVQVALNGEILVGYASRKPGTNRGLQEA